MFASCSLSTTKYSDNYTCYIQCFDFYENAIMNIPTTFIVETLVNKQLPVNMLTVFLKTPFHASIIFTFLFF